MKILCSCVYIFRICIQFRGMDQRDFAFLVLFVFFGNYHGYFDISGIKKCLGCWNFGSLVLNFDSSF